MFRRIKETAKVLTGSQLCAGPDVLSNRRVIDLTPVDCEKPVPTPEPPKAFVLCVKFKDEDVELVKVPTELIEENPDDIVARIGGKITGRFNRGLIDAYWLEVI